MAERDPRVRKIAGLLAEGGVPREQMGITGSMLVGLHSPSSDIDFVVYGPLWWKARDIVARAKAEGKIGDLDEATWRKIYSKRKPEISFDEFMLHEMRKGNRGMIDGTYFDLLFTRDWSQIHPQPAGKPAGECRIEAKVTQCRFRLRQSRHLPSGSPRGKGDILLFAYLCRPGAARRDYRGERRAGRDCSGPTVGGGNHTRGSRRMDQIANLAGKLKQ